MKTWDVFVLCIIVGLIALPMVSAKEEYAVNSSVKGTFVPDQKYYIVRPWIENSSNVENSVLSMRSIWYISQEQTITHKINVVSGVDYLEVYLDWGDTSDSLRLQIYTPSGNNVGTYHDDFDGSINGMIHLRIDPSQGHVEEGTWKFKAYGESVSGTEDYTFNVYQY